MYEMASADAASSLEPRCPMNACDRMLFANCETLKAYTGSASMPMRPVSRMNPPNPRDATRPSSNSSSSSDGSFSPAPVSPAGDDPSSPSLSSEVIVPAGASRVDESGALKVSARTHSRNQRAAASGAGVKARRPSRGTRSVFGERSKNFLPKVIKADSELRNLRNAF